MISTPETAFKWLLSIGIDRESALKLCDSREKFEYFVNTLSSMLEVLSK